jgi:hypothetical protein
VPHGVIDGLNVGVCPHHSTHQSRPENTMGAPCPARNASTGRPMLCSEDRLGEGACVVAIVGS